MFHLLLSVLLFTDADVALLREQGPYAVRRMIEQGPTDDPRFQAALDRVCQQKGCITSGLY
jgi:hypothetical protein